MLYKFGIFLNTASIDKTKLHEWTEETQFEELPFDIAYKTEITDADDLQQLVVDIHYNYTYTLKYDDAEVHTDSDTGYVVYGGLDIFNEYAKYCLIVVAPDMKIAERALKSWMIDEMVDRIEGPDEEY